MKTPTADESRRLELEWEIARQIAIAERAHMTRKALTAELDALARYAKPLPDRRRA